MCASGADVFVCLLVVSYLTWDRIQAACKGSDGGLHRQSKGGRERERERERERGRGGVGRGDCNGGSRRQFTDGPSHHSAPLSADHSDLLSADLSFFSSYMCMNRTLA